MDVMKLNNLLKLGKQLYDCERWINYRCVMVFLVRSLLHYKEVQNLNSFFQINSLRCEVIKRYPIFFAQLTRHFFYKGSSASERMVIITESFLVWENQFSKQALQQIYLGSGLLLWKDIYKEQSLAIELAFRSGEIREGTMSLGLKLNNKYIYHINFWIVFDTSNKLFLYIGALQGSRDGLSINKELTKHFLGCRPKNLILFALRILAQNLSIEGIAAVSNYGFYANNHLRQDRKLKTSLDTFWTEIGGNLSHDRRFYILPLTEHRKNIEEVVSHKRNLYRKRFDVLDKIAADITTALNSVKKTYSTTINSPGTSAADFSRNKKLVMRNCNANDGNLKSRKEVNYDS